VFRFVWRAGTWGPEALAASIALVAAISVGGSSWARGFPLDDAWIHMVYGLSLAREYGFHYNSGIAGAGATSPLWATVVGLVHFVVDESGPSAYAMMGTKACGVLAHTCTAVLATRFVRASAPANVRNVAGCTAGAVVAACPALAFSAMSGMEVSLTAALLLAALAAAGAKRGPAAGALAGLAACARPEALVVMPFALLLAFRDRASSRRVQSERVSSGTSLWRPFLSFACAFIAPGVWVIRNVVVSGRPLPATVYAKSARALGEDETFVQALRKVFTVMLPFCRPLTYGVVLALAFAAVVLGLRAVVRAIRHVCDDDASEHAMTAGAAGLTAFIYVGGLCWHTRFFHPTSFYFQRYLHPVLPLFIVASVAVFAWLVVRVLPRYAHFVVGVMGIAVTAWEIAQWNLRRADFEAAVAQVESVQVAAGRFIASSLPPDATVWSADAGAIRYFGRRRTVDLEGLNTPELVHDVEIPGAWNADAIVLQIPYGYGAWVDRAVPPIALELPSGWKGMPVQAIAYCPSSSPGRLLVLKGRAVVAKGHCRGSSSSSP
jgi:hypothetical protein